ncbi:MULTISPECIES: leucyl aminopeptidase family protein [Pseudoalteromonas]|uniref:Leucyl aminopeptidase n=1 Tax=Pseudoalteromonas luteoviolacea (strain 2ta16) TaxID=1353533 RepID=V4HXJ9_PSEL2|nr:MULTISPECIES: leucyl aminopeptidase family protein [Pseudoalteromonas]ESP94513.1 leucyl aminopeptidase [Pseudoalteromonas luteoviolacea 2ta16]KZN32209.1 cytosol aminopeptidase [Pseudoalteromonas luteoviolacea NCIMB 1944]MCG7548007.1 leucyl aminopeptidase family protein [Pseudoalteromonas sp. Of7M-16]
MSTLLVHSQEGTPIHLTTEPQLDGWLSENAQAAKSFVLSTRQEGQNVLLIPDLTSGALSSVVCVVDSLDDQWLAGDLAKQLPQGVYQFIGDEALIERAATSYILGAYKYSAYKKTAPIQAKLAISAPELYKKVADITAGIYLVRDLVNTPAADMMPQHLAETFIELSEQFGGEFKQFIGDELLEHNYPTIHMVGRASDNKPRLLDLTWGDESAPKLTLVGKGVCFDSGGLDLKPAAGMRNMKKDMGGAAHVLGLAHMIMAANLPVRLRVLVPAVENAVSKNAFRPGDVIVTRKGITVEIDNTDAEGRLVLCDALAEAQAEQPDLLIDFATLTGACRIALGTELPGFYSTDQQIANDIIAEGLELNDPVWQLPLFDQYKALFKSDIADISNCGSTPFGGSITAALYLKEFVEPETTPWLHFDVMAWNVRHLPGRPVGGEGLGLRATFSYLQKRFG